MSADGGTALRGPYGGVLKPFAPGQSGNPGGIGKAKRAVKLLARENCQKAMQVIVDLMDCETDAVRLAAAIEVKNTAIGKPRVRDLTREEIEREVDKRIAELARKAHEALQQGAIDVTPEEGPDDQPTNTR
jgi:hypothetical protein